MSTSYARLARRAAALIADKGMSAILSQAGPMIGPAWAAVPGPPMETSVNLVVVSQGQVASPDGAATRLVKSLLIAVGPLFNPKKGDTLIFDDASHEILSVKPFAPANVVIYYEAEAAT